MSSSIVARYSTVGEAESARTALEAAGIEVQVLDAEMISLYWTYSNLLGGVKLLVRDEDLDQSEMVLATMPREATAAEVAEEALQVVEEAPPVNPRDTIDDRCPRCGSVEFYSIHYRRLKASSLLYPPLIVPVLLIWPFLPKRRCEQCGRKAW
ncbi:MAG TPA: hypothetical protein VEK79_07380 [Thermoanaerobaculia bacterium]|nr:hypothetical protein [Thermoanaerobaculia bacterium]